VAVAFAEDDKERVTARAAAAPRSGWSGTIVWDYISQHHEVRDAETADITWHRRLQITVENGVATASGTYLLSLDDTYSWPGCNRPPGRDTYTWNAKGTGPVSFAVQRDPGRYTVFTGLVTVAGTITHTNHGHDRACADVNIDESEPFTENVSVQLPMSGERTAGMDVLSGSKTEPIESDCTGGGYDSCTFSGERSVTWSLVRTKKLTLNKFGLYDRDQL